MITRYVYDAAVATIEVRVRPGIIGTNLFITNCLLNRFDVGRVLNVNGQRVRIVSVLSPSQAIVDREIRMPDQCTFWLHPMQDVY